MDYGTSLEIVKQVMIPAFYNESQIGRSVRKKGKAFKKVLFDTIMGLLSKVDDDILRNQDIREGIKYVAQKTGVSAGQSQKVINVYLKYYCILHGNKRLIKELDCPLDSVIMKLVWSKMTEEEITALETALDLKKRGLSLNSVLFFEITRLVNMWYGLYEIIQTKLEEIGDGYRLKPDLETYDKQRIDAFLHGSD